MNQSSALSLAKLKGWLASPQAISYSLVVFALVWPFATGFLAGETTGAEFAFSIHLFDLIGSSLLAATLLVFKLLIGRLHSTHEGMGRNVLLNIAVIAIASLSGSWLPVQIVGLFSDVPNLYRESVPFGFVSLFATCLVFVFVSSAINEQRIALRSLATARRSLAFLRENLKSELAENRAALKTQIQNVLEPTFTQLVTELKSGASHELLAAKLKQAIDTVVRPLSHDLASPSDSADVPALLTIRQLEKSITRLPLRERWAHQVLMREAVSLPLVVIAHLVFIIPSTIFLNGTQGFGASLLAAVVIAVFHYGFVKLFGARTAKYLQVLGIALLLGIGSSLLYFLALGAVVQNSSATSVVAVAVAVFIANFVTGFFSCQLSIRQSSLEAAALVNANLQDSITALKQDVWLNRRRFARAVHGSVQANLQSAAIRLIRGNNSGEVSADGLADELAQSLMVSLSDQSRETNLASALQSLKEFWSGACELTISVEPELLSLIQDNLQTAECLYELISEAVSNAVKHASADEVDVQIIRSGDALQVEIRNAQGIATSPGNLNVAGYGSRIYDEITSAWSLTFDDTDAILKASLPLSK